MVTMAVGDIMSMQYLDILEYSKASKTIQDPVELAEFQGKKIEAAIESAVYHIKNDQQDLATKTDLALTKVELKTEINELRSDFTELRTEFSELRSDFSELRSEFSELRSEFHELRSEVKGERGEYKYDMQKLRYDCLKFVIWTGATVVAVLGGMMGHGFHWF